MRAWNPSRFHALGYRRCLPASTAAATATTVASATTAATAAGALGSGPGLVDSESPAAEFLAIGGVDSRLHVLLRNLYECEALVADDSYFDYWAVGFEQLPDVILGCAVGHVSYIQ